MSKSVSCMHIVTSIFGRTSSDRENGASVVDTHFINLTAAQGHKVTVIVPDKRAEGITLSSSISIIYCFPKKGILVDRIIKVFQAAWTLIQLYKADPEAIFRSNSFFSSLLEIVPLLLFSGGKARLFVQFHHRDSNLIRNFFVVQVLRHASMIVCPSHAARQELIEIMGFVPKGLNVIHHGVDEKFFQIFEKRSRMVKSILEPKFRLLFVGHLERRKNTFALLMLAKALFGRLNFEIAIVGKGPELVGLLQASRDQPWGASVLFLGEVSEEDKFQEYEKADLFVFPSTQEGFGLVLCEAMACGLPVLAFQISAMPEIVLPGAGYLVAVNDIDAMAEIILNLSGDEFLLKLLSEGAISHARTSFHWERTVHEICLHLASSFPTGSSGLEPTHLLNKRLDHFE